jgi:transcriptional regulator with XRE-family HTH domain
MPAAYASSWKTHEPRKQNLVNGARRRLSGPGVFEELGTSGLRTRRRGANACQPTVGPGPPAPDLLQLGRAPLPPRCRNHFGKSGAPCMSRQRPFFLALSLTVVFGLFLTVDCFTKRPEIALRPRLPPPLLGMESPPSAHLVSSADAYAFWINFQVTDLPLYGGMVLPLAIGAVVEGMPTTSQMPLSGQDSPVRAVVPTSAILILFSVGDPISDHLNGNKVARRDATAGPKVRHSACRPPLGLGGPMPKTKVDAPALQAALDQARIAKGISWRQLAADSGVTPSLLSRLRNGYKPDADGFMTLVRWLGMPAERFLVADDADRPTRQPELTAELAPLLRARKDLDESDVKMLEEVIQATLRSVAARREVR